MAPPVMLECNDHDPSFLFLFTLSLFYIFLLFPHFSFCLVEAATKPLPPPSARLFLLPLSSKVGVWNFLNGHLDHLYHFSQQVWVGWVSGYGINSSLWRWMSILHFQLGILTNYGIKWKLGEFSLEYRRLTTLCLNIQMLAWVGMWDISLEVCL